MNQLPPFEYWNLKDYYVKDATSNFDSTIEHKITVPANKRWIILFGVVNRDQSSSLVITIHKSTDDCIGIISVEGEGTGRTAFPQNAGSYGPKGPIILKAGDYIKFVFGSAQGTGAYIGMQYLELREP